jgi:hypothetical protein
LVTAAASDSAFKEAPKKAVEKASVEAVSYGPAEEGASSSPVFDECARGADWEDEDSEAVLLPAGALEVRGSAQRLAALAAITSSAALSEAVPLGGLR